MGNKSSKIPVLAIALTDIIMVNLGIVLAFALKTLVSFGMDVQQENWDAYLGLIPWLIIAACIIFYMFDLYSDWRRKSLYNLIYSIVLSVLTLTLATMALTFWYRGFAFPRSVIVIMPVVQILLLTVSRWSIWALNKKLHGRKKVLIIGESLDEGLALAEKFLAHTEGWFIVHDFLPVNELKKLESKLADVDVVLLGSAVQHKVDLVNRCSKYEKEVLVVPEAFELFIVSSETQQVDDMLVLSIQPPKLNPGQRMVKRAFDLAASLVILIICSPVIVLMFILIPLTSAGPALYKQERLGREGKPYNILKFRSMVSDAEKLTGPVLATEEDPRITPVGRFIRATRIDELPQLFNVLLGDMSLVGPRPERSFFIEQFLDALPHYSYRLSVKPGITGLAQVMAKYSTTVEDKLRFDLMYVRNYSLALDIKILLQTIRVVLQREQAKGISERDEEINHKIITLFQKRNSG